MKTERITTYWGNFFGIEVDELRKPGVIVVPHNYLEDYHGAWIFKRNRRTIISVPLDMIDQVTDILKRNTYNEKDVFSKNFLELLFGTNIERTIGPAYQGYYDNHQSVIQTSKNVNEINYAKDGELIARLSQSGDEEGWSNSSINMHSDGMYGYFHKSKIESIGSYNIVRGDAAFIGIYAHPAYRGKGFSYEVLKRLVMDLSSQGKLIRYQTLISNKASIRLAKKVGFLEYAKHVAIRFKKA